MLVVLPTEIKSYLKNLSELSRAHFYQFHIDYKFHHFSIVRTPQTLPTQELGKYPADVIGDTRL